MQYTIYINTYHVYYSNAKNNFNINNNNSHMIETVCGWDIRWMPKTNVRVYENVSMEKYCRFMQFFNIRIGEWGFRSGRAPSSTAPLMPYLKYIFQNLSKRNVSIRFTKQTHTTYCLQIFVSEVCCHRWGSRFKKIARVSQKSNIYIYINLWYRYMRKRGALPGSRNDTTNVE